MHILTKILKCRLRCVDFALIKVSLSLSVFVVNKKGLYPNSIQLIPCQSVVFQLCNLFTRNVLTPLRFRFSGSVFKSFKQ